MSSNNYGTLAANSSAAENGSHDTSEEGPLLGKPTSTHAASKRFQKHMTADVNKNWADMVLLAGYVITGLLDSASISIWGAFVSMQTGNTIYLGLGLSNPSGGTKWIKSLISIVAFCLGSMFFGFYHRRLGGPRRWVLTSSYFIQLLCIVGAALIIFFGPDMPTDDKSLNWVIAVPLALLAFQSSGQAITSRVLQYNGLTSVVLTSNYCDLFSDPKLFTGLTQNPARNRRLAAPILCLIGAVAGGFSAHSDVGLTGALWAAAALKTCIVAAWMVWPAEKEAQ